MLKATITGVSADRIEVRIFNFQKMKSLISKKIFDQSFSEKNRHCEVMMEVWNIRSIFKKYISTIKVVKFFTKIANLFLSDLKTSVFFRKKHPILKVMMQVWISKNK